MRFNNFLKEIIADRSGGTAIEYGLIAALIVIAMMTALQDFANSTNNMWGRVDTTMKDAVQK